MPTTKIVATLGPSSRSGQAIHDLITAGVNVFRINASHARKGEISGLIRAVRETAGELGTNTSILLDLQGPKIRLETFENGQCVLEEGAGFILTTEPVTGTCRRASTTYKEFARDVTEGDRILLADGSVELRALSSDGVQVACQVVTGGPIGDYKGINLPGVRISTPSLTRKDMADLREGLEAGIDFVALSFVRSREDVLRLRHFLDENEASIPIVSKIEKPEGWENLDSILGESDGVMVARGDLGVEMAVEKVPAIQKEIIREARRKAKFVITATQMLESMIRSPFPTRAEVSDVANAIYDGTDAVMLSAETSIGQYPVEAVGMMARIANETEISVRRKGFPPLHPAADMSDPRIIAHVAIEAAQLVNAAAIVVFSVSGSSGRLVSSYRPPVPVYVFTRCHEVARQLTVNYGIRPVVAPQLESTDEMLAQVDKMLCERRSLKPKDTVVFTAGQPIGRKGATNMLKIHRVGELG
ncbi:MAG: Pyruvate kinase [Bryobacteraceae bacterium]|nr:Pyruvate kinase [Bryobacteraceae bacterium]